MIEMLDNDYATDKMRAGLWEPDVEQFLRAHLRPGDRFLDVGAHVGYFSHLAVQLGACVTAIEPNPALLPLLRRNVPKATIIESAVYNRAMTVQLAPPREEGHIGTTHIWSKEGVSVPCVTLDSLGLVADVVKIDIEGAEYAALAAAPLLLAGARALVCEMSPETMKETSGVTPQALCSLLWGAGFTVYLTDDPTVPGSVLDLSFKDGEYCNVRATKGTMTTEGETEGEEKVAVLA